MLFATSIFQNYTIPEITTTAVVFIALVWLISKFILHEIELKNLRNLVKSQEIPGAELQKSTDELRVEDMATIGQLAAGVAHEINNPLSYVISNISIIEKRSEAIKTSFLLSASLAEELQSGQMDDIEKKAKEIVSFNKSNQIDLAIADLKDLIDESNEGLLRIKNIVANLGQFAAQGNESKEPININDCVESAIEITWNKLKYKCKVNKEYSTTLPKIIGSFKQLEIVFINLLLNAEQAITSEGVITITTAVSNTDILIRITDNGRGIEQDQIDKLFTPFFTTKPIGEGRGLGLAISCRIIKNHGGTIRVESQVGKGSTFIVELPIVNKS